MSDHDPTPPGTGPDRGRQGHRARPTGSKWTGWNFADVWEAVADLRGDETALLHPGQSLTWAAVDRAADGVAQWLLDHGVGRHGVVALCMRNRPEYLIAMFGCFKVGAVPANTNVRYTAAELAALWSRSAVRAVVHDAGSAAAVGEAVCGLADVRATACVPRDPGDRGPGRWADIVARGVAGRHRAAPFGRSGDDPCVLFTGGTTGTPKGVLWRQDDLFALLNRTTQRPWPADRGAEGVTAELAARSGAGPRLLVAAPLMHGLGVLTAMSALAAAGSVATLAGTSFAAVEFLDFAEQVGATQATIVGDAMARPVLEQLRAHPARWALPALRVLLSSGASWSPATKREIAGAFPKVRCVDVLGATEAIGVASAVTATSPDEGQDGDRHFVLGPDTGVVDDELRPVRPGSGVPGRVVVRGRGPIGYLGDPVASSHVFLERAGERWTVLGDWATVEADGAIRLLGRGTTVINTGGEKVFPGEVEDALRACPGIADAAVVGVPDERFGEQVAALVELAPGHVLDPADLRRRLRGTLAGFKLPRALVATGPMRSPDGKFDRRSLQQHAADVLTGGRADTALCRTDEGVRPYAD